MERERERREARQKTRSPETEEPEDLKDDARNLVLAGKR